MPPRFSRWEKSILASKLQKTGLLGVNADGDLKLKSQCSFTIPKILGLSKWSEAAQSYLTLCDPMDCSLPGSSLHGILQARVLGWVAISFSRGSSRPRDQTQVSCIAGKCFNLWATREAHKFESHHEFKFRIFHAAFILSSARKKLKLGSTVLSSSLKHSEFVRFFFSQAKKILLNS